MWRDWPAHKNDTPVCLFLLQIVIGNGRANDNKSSANLWKNVIWVRAKLRLFGHGFQSSRQVLKVICESIAGITWCTKRHPTISIIRASAIILFILLYFSTSPQFFFYLCLPRCPLLSLLFVPFFNIYTEPDLTSSLFWIQICWTIFIFPCFYKTSKDINCTTFYSPLFAFLLFLPFNNLFLFFTTYPFTIT